MTKHVVHQKHGELFISDFKPVTARFDGAYIRRRATIGAIDFEIEPSCLFAALLQDRDTSETG